MLTDVEVLRRARALITAPSRWTQVKVARNAKGLPVTAQSEEAVCFCATGAVAKVVVPTWFSPEALWQAMRLLRLLDKLSGCPDADPGYDAYPGYNPSPRPLAQFNDSHSHAEVLALFDRAIAQLEADHG